MFGISWAEFIVILLVAILVIPARYCQEGLGNMTIVFDKKPVALNSWTIVDAVGNKTDVVFSNLKTKTDFGKNYFQIQRHKTVSTSGGDDFYD